LLCEGNIKRYQPAKRYGQAQKKRKKDSQN